MLSISILLYLLCSFVLCAVFYERITLAKLLVTFFLTVYACNVLIMEILSLAGMTNQPWIYLLSQFVVCSVGIGFLFIKKWFSLQLFKTRIGSFFTGWHTIDYVMACLMGAIFGAFFYVGITTPPNNVDTLHTHLTRIYYWFQHGSFAYWNATSSSHLNYPINGHIQGLWLFLLGRSENLFFLVQWFSLIVVTACVYEIARALDFKPTQALFSAFVGLSFPIALLQTYSFQGDLTVAALGMVCIALLLQAFLSKKTRFLLAEMLALILAIGTKQTAFFIVPVLAICVVYWLIKNKKRVKILPIIGVCAGFFICFASYQYVQNFVNTGSILGVDDVLGNDYVDFSQLGEKAKYVFPRYLYQFIGVDGVPRYKQSSLIQVKANIFKQVLDPIGINLEENVFLQAGFTDDEQFYYDALPVLSEDNAWFGPFAFPLITIALVIALFFTHKKIRRDYALFALLISLTYGFMIFLQRPGWDPYQGRYFILGVFPLVPLISILIPEHPKWKFAPIIVIVPMAVFLAFNTCLTNNYKPIIYPNTIINFQNLKILPLPEETKFQIIVKNYLVKTTNRIAEAGNTRRNIYTLSYEEQVFTGSKAIVQNVQFVDQNIPPHDAVYFTNQRSTLEYGLFGRNKTRDIYPVDDISEVESGYYVTDIQTAIIPSEMIRQIASNDNLSIYYVEPDLE